MQKCKSGNANSNAKLSLPPGVQIANCKLKNAKCKLKIQIQAADQFSDGGWKVPGLTM